jgi:hypothetical protein
MDGLSLVGPALDADLNNYQASYVTTEEMATTGRYRRCKTCSPDAPEGPPPAQAHLKRAETLTAADLGRVTVDGAIERIEHTLDGTVVTLETGEVLNLPSGNAVAFPKPARIRKSVR